jgi:hypothetical protein
MVTNFQFLDTPRQAITGHQIIAYLDLKVGEIIIRDIALVNYSSDTLGIWAPSLVHKREPAVVFTGRLRSEITAEAELALRYAVPAQEAA